MDRIQIFVSWSGNASRAVGEALKRWLPKLWDSVDVWISTEDVNKGTKWESEIVVALQKSRFGIVCLTPDSLIRPWLLFEAGAISTLPQSRVFTFLHEIKSAAEVKQPLGMFQHTLSTQDDVGKMILSLNRELGSVGAEESVLKDRFDAFWPKLCEELANIHSLAPSENPPSASGLEMNDSKLIREILSTVRDTAKSVTPRGRNIIDESNRTVRSIVLDRLSEKLRQLGVRYQQMSMTVEVSGGITIKLAGGDVEIPIGEAADVVDGITTPVDFLRRLGLTEKAIS